ncbi:MAG: PE-PPE domain-containing protein [Mycobacterium sp.]
MTNSFAGRDRLHRHQLWFRAGIVAAGVGTAALVGCATAAAESDTAADGAGQSAPAAAAAAPPSAGSGQSISRESDTTAESDNAEDAADSADSRGTAAVEDEAVPKNAREVADEPVPATEVSDSVDVPESVDPPEVKVIRSAKVADIVKVADVAKVVEAPKDVEAPTLVEAPKVAEPAAPVEVAPAATTNTATAAATIDYGAGSGARVAVIAGVLGSPTAVMKQLNGSVCASPNKCDPIYYFAVGDFLGPLFGRWSIDDGVSKLDAWIRATPGPKIAMGHSFGAVIITSWLRKYGSDPTAPSPAELSFITLASPENRSSAYAYSGRSAMFDYRVQDGLGIPADTRYRVVDTCRKWDGWCDWHPDNISTSQWGMFWLHTDYTNLNLNDPANDVVVKGNVTYVLLPTPGWP